MSHKYGGKNLERAAWLRELAEWQALAVYFNEQKEKPGMITMMLEQAQAEVSKHSGRKPQSACPLCKRLFYKGDALCHCKPADTIKGPDNQPVKCAPRIVGLANRHMLRQAIVNFKRFQRKHGRYLKRKALEAAIPVYKGPFNAETKETTATAPSLVPPPSIQESVAGGVA